MKYDKEKTDLLVSLYADGKGDSPEVLAEKFETTTRSIIAKLSSVGVYHPKEYVDKRGNPPVKKAEIIDRIAILLDVNAELIESLEKANKNVLIMIEKALLEQ